MMVGVKVPIACSLTSEDARGRVAEWRELLESSIDRVERTDSVARLHVVGDDQTLLRVVDLAEREKACCPFFDFSLELGHDQRWLRVSVPPDAAAVLNELLPLLPRDIRRRAER
jgi:MerR family copper efflux transcriptional regulator